MVTIILLSNPKTSYLLIFLIYRSLRARVCDRPPRPSIMLNTLPLKPSPSIWWPSATRVIYFTCRFSLFFVCTFGFFFPCVIFISLESPIHVGILSWMYALTRSFLLNDAKSLQGRKKKVKVGTVKCENMQSNVKKNNNNKIRANYRKRWKQRYYDAFM